MGFSPGWVKLAKRSMSSILPRFNATRMVGEYLSKSYAPAAKQGRRYSGDGFAGARLVAQWKKRVRAAWPTIAARRLDAPTRRIQFGEAVHIEIAVRLNGLSAQDVVAELLMSCADAAGGEGAPQRQSLVAAGPIGETGEHRFALEFTPRLCGKLNYRIRVYPCHELLTHPFETGLMLWV